jgi:hypothetical protein
MTPLAGSLAFLVAVAVLVLATGRAWRRAAWRRAAWRRKQ